MNITGRRSQLSSIHWVNSWLHSMLIRAEASREYYSCLQRTYASFIYLAQMVKKPTTCNAGDLGSIPASGKSPGDGNGYPLHYSYLENSMDRGAWWAMVRRKGHKQLDTIGRPGTHCWKSKHNFLQAFWWTRKIYLDPLHCKYSGREVNFLGFFLGRIIKITFEINIFNNNGKVWLKT